MYNKKVQTIKYRQHCLVCNFTMICHTKVWCVMCLWIRLSNMWEKYFLQLNIPLNLPHLTTTTNCGIYEDDAVPLRIHDCSLDLVVLTDSNGFVCICHHYLYQVRCNFLKMFILSVFLKNIPQIYENTYLNTESFCKKLSNFKIDSNFKLPWLF